MTRVTDADVLADLRLGLSEIAQIAQVRRPVVTTWRRRYANGADPFPAPCSEQEGRMLYRAGSVADWIERTGLGNNASFRTDLAARAVLSDLSDEDREHTLGALTGLLRLKAATGRRLSDLDHEDLADLADDVDPGDVELYTEVTSLGAAVERLAVFADLLTDAAYGTGAAVESVLWRRFRRGASEPEGRLLTPAGLGLVASVARALMKPGEVTVFDPHPDAGDLLQAVLATVEDQIDEPVAMLPARQDLRFVRRRLGAHGWQVIEHRSRARVGRRGDGTPLVVTQPASPADADPGHVRLLHQIEELALDLAPGQRAVVLGPAATLVDPLADPEAESLRADLLRTDKLRAAVLLPAGFVLSRPRERLALWVLGDAHPDVPIGQRWVMVTDLADVAVGELGLDRAVREDLLTDVLAAMGTQADVAAHAFRYARFVLTAQILAGGTGLLARARPLEQGARDDGGTTGARVTELLDSLATRPLPRVEMQVGRGDAVVLRTASVAELLERRVLRRLSGHRLAPEELTEGGATGTVPVIGVEEITGEAQWGSRRVDRLRLAGRFPAVRMTEPGDVVFTTTPRPAARVDGEGFSVVPFPAKILRILQPAVGMVPAVLAADLADHAESAGNWRSWRVRLLPRDQVESLADAVAQVSRREDALRAQLRETEELTRLLSAGVATGVVRLRDDQGDPRQ